MDFAALFNQFAFPAACCIMMGYIMLQQDKGNREALAARDAQIQKLNEMHAAETAKWVSVVTDSLNNNTVAIEHLSTIISEREGQIHDKSAC